MGEISKMKLIIFYYKPMLKIVNNLFVDLCLWYRYEQSNDLVKDLDLMGN